jgi:hypothetical protein
MCEWCGDEHPVTALCTKRPKWGRRGFLALFGAGVAGLLVAPAVPVTEPEWISVRFVGDPVNVETQIWLAADTVWRIAPSVVVSTRPPFSRTKNRR